MDIVPLDFVILDVEVLHKTDLSTCLRKEEVLADVIKHGRSASFMTSGRPSQALSRRMDLRLSMLTVWGVSVMDAVMAEPETSLEVNKRLTRVASER